MDADTPEQPGPQGIPPGFRLQNGVLVPSEQPAITRIVPRVKPKPDPRRKWVLGGVALLFLVIIAAAVAARQKPAVPPAGEKNFLSAVVHGQQRVRHGNAVTLVAARMERARSLCRVLQRDRTVHGWAGTIHDIDTDDDEGVVTVSIGHDTDLRTGSGFGADKRTLLRPGSGIFEAVAKLHDGDRVVFSGTFARDPRTCVRATNLFARNAMLSPDFLFLFRAIAPG